MTLSRRAFLRVAGGAIVGTGLGIHGYQADVPEDRISHYAQKGRMSLEDAETSIRTLRGLAKGAFGAGAGAITAPWIFKNFLNDNKAVPPSNGDGPR